MNRIRLAALSAALVVVMGAFNAANAAIITILNFGQSNNQLLVTGDNNGAGVTTVTATDVPITITQLENGATPLSAFFSLSLTSSGDAEVGLGGGILQLYSGNLQINSAAGQLGTNYLSATASGGIVGALGAGATSLTFATSQPPAASVGFTTDGPITSLFLPRSFSLSFTGLPAGVSIDNGSIADFTATVSGLFSASDVPLDVVPEPTSMLLLGTGLVGVASRLRRRKV